MVNRLMAYVAERMRGPVTRADRRRPLPRACAPDQAGIAPDALAYMDGKMAAFREAGRPRKAAEVAKDIETLHEMAIRRGFRVERATD